MPLPIESKGLTQNIDIKVDEWSDEQKNEPMDGRDKNYIPPDSMLGYNLPTTATHGTPNQISGCCREVTAMERSNI